MTGDQPARSASQRLEHAVGVVWSLVTGESGTARTLLQTGILVLLMTPVARVVVSIAQYVSDRDWSFATLTAIVLIELLASAVAALMFNKKL